MQCSDLWEVPKISFTSGSSALLLLDISSFCLISSILSSLECIPLETAGHRLSLPPPPGCPLRAFSMCSYKRKSGQQVGQTSSSQLGCGNVTTRAKLKVLGIKATPATLHSFPFKGHCLCSRQMPGCYVGGYLLYTTHSHSARSHSTTSLSSRALTCC